MMHGSYNIKHVKRLLILIILILSSTVSFSFAQNFEGNMLRIPAGYTAPNGVITVKK